jgi:class 3 adenylate cyclase
VTGAPGAFTFLFADLAGFTTLTEELGDERAADLAVGFCDRVCELNPGHGAEDVKGLGDACMIRAADPALAVQLGLRIVGDIGADHGFPEVRVGMHHGPAVQRRGDWYGATVNIAYRVAALAREGEVLLSEDVHRAAGSIQGVRFTSRGAHDLRHVSRPVVLYAAEAADADIGGRRAGRRPGRM